MARQAGPRGVHAGAVPGAGGTGRRRSWQGPVAALMAAAALALASAPGGAGQPVPQEAGRSYRLVETWSDAAWSLTAGRIGRVADVSSAADGTVFLLDGLHGAVHVFSPAGAPRHVFRVPPVMDAPTPCAPLRLDAAPDGRVAVLGSCGDPDGPLVDGASHVGYVLHMGADGSVLQSTLLPTAYDDVAVTPDGLLVLARMAPAGGPSSAPSADGPSRAGGLDVVDGAGRLIRRIEHPALYFPVGVDVDADGAIVVANRVPGPWSYDQPGPRPTALPHRLLSGAEDGAVEGVVVFGPDGEHLRTVPFTAPEDVAVGGAGAFVSRHVEVFRVGEREPLYRGPIGQLVTSVSDGFILTLDAPARGGLLAGLAHCYHQGLLLFDEPPTAGAPPRLAGALDRPELRGPALPARIAAGLELWLLQDRFLVEGAGAERLVFSGPFAREPQAVQRWSMEGRLVEQLGVCSGSTSQWLPDSGTALWTADVAVDGSAVYTLDRDLLQRRTGAFPDWSLWPGAQAPLGARSHLVAAAADAGHVAVLDVGTNSVAVVRADGSLEARWSLDTEGLAAVPGDLALGGRTVVVADTAQRRLRRYTLAGAPDGAWPTHDEPWRLDVGPDGDVFVLSRRGWIMRYDGRGELVAVWATPDRAARAVDLAVGPDGRVYTAFVRREAVPRGAAGSSVVTVDGAGIWVFEPVSEPQQTRPGPGACWATAERSVAPAAVRLGGEVTVTTSVTGACPAAVEPARVILALDTSRSMNWSEATDRARQVSLAVLASMDPRAVQVGLVTFDDDGRLRVPLTGEHANVAAAVAAAEAWGDTRLGAGLRAAVDELGSERGDGMARRLIVIVTDGGHTDAAEDVARVSRAARAAGIRIMAVAFPHGDAARCLDDLAALTGDRAQVLVDPDPEAAARTVRSLLGQHEEPGLFRSVEVVERLPGNTRYVPGSAVPEPESDGDALRWRFEDVAAARGLDIRYRLQPLAPGPWQDGAGEVRYEDVLGGSGRLSLPPPRLDVWDPRALSERAYLPRVAAGVVAGRAGSGPDQGRAVQLYLPLVGRPAAGQRFASDLHAARAWYPHISGTPLNHCRLCHELDARFGLNPYGRDYRRHGRDFAAIELLDSDGDGFSNLTEILALTFPGSANSYPAATPSPKR